LTAIIRSEESLPNRKIVALGNTVVPGLLALEQLGFDVVVKDKSSGQTVIAIREGEEYQADDPVTVLGLIKLIEIRSWEWRAADSDIDGTLQKYHLDRTSS
jgi:hypothetical protein